MKPVRWQLNRSVASNFWPHPLIMTAVSRGLLGRCPACGKSYLGLMLTLNLLKIDAAGT